MFIYISYENHFSSKKMIYIVCLRLMGMNYRFMVRYMFFFIRNGCKRSGVFVALSLVLEKIIKRRRNRHIPGGQNNTNTKTGILSKFRKFVNFNIIVLLVLFFNIFCCYYFIVSFGFLCL
jgi:hypothetical protein